MIAEAWLENSRKFCCLQRTTALTPLDDEAEPNCGALAQVNSLGEVSLQASTCLEKKAQRIRSCCRIAGGWCVIV